MQTSTNVLVVNDSNGLQPMARYLKRKGYMIPKEKAPDSATFLSVSEGYMASIPAALATEHNVVSRASEKDIFHDFEARRAGLLRALTHVFLSEGYMDSTAASTENNVGSRACNVEEIFNDFIARRAGLLKALTDDVVRLHMECDPDKENLRLYGLPNRSWELKVPEEDEYELTTCKIHRGYLSSPRTVIRGCWQSLSTLQPNQDSI